MWKMEGLIVSLHNKQGLQGMKKIIIPYDFSAEAEQGVNMGLTLARNYEAAIQLVYVVSGPRDYANLSPEEERKMAEKELEEITKKLKASEKGKGIDIQPIVKMGKVYREVVAQAEAHREAVIVTSTHGASGFEEFFIGSNTLRIIAAAHCPVFTVMHGVMPVDAYKKIIFPLDISFQSRQKAPYVAYIAHRLGASVHVLAVAESPNEQVVKRLQNYRVQMVEYFKKQNVEATSETREGVDLVDATIMLCENSPASMVAITPRERDSYHLFLVGGKSQRIISQAPVPVLVVPPSVQPLNTAVQTQGRS